MYKGLRGRMALIRTLPVDRLAALGFSCACADLTFQIAGALQMQLKRKGDPPGFGRGGFFCGGFISGPGGPGPAEFDGAACGRVTNR